VFVEEYKKRGKGENEKEGKRGKKGKKREKEGKRGNKRKRRERKRGSVQRTAPTHSHFKVGTLTMAILY